MSLKQCTRFVVFNFIIKILKSIFILGITGDCPFVDIKLMEKFLIKNQFN